MSRKQGKKDEKEGLGRKKEGRKREMDKHKYKEVGRKEG